MQTGQEISKVQTTIRAAPRSTSIQLANALSIALNALVGGGMTEAALPSGARLGLETRSRELAAALAPPRPEKVRSLLAQLGTLPSRDEDDPTVRLMLVEQYVVACSDVPEWALEWAVWAFIKNEAGGSQFRPTAGELRSFAMRRVSDVIAERQKIESVLRAPAPVKLIGPEDRKRMADMLREAAEAFRMRDLEVEQKRGARELEVVRRAQETIEEAARKVDDAFSHIQGPLTVSDELRVSNASRNRTLAETSEDANHAA
jgi:hypothetical protein